MADIKAMPLASDACFLCTNMRYVDGRKPTFIDHKDSWFMIPLGLIRLVEIPKVSVDRAQESEGILALPAGPDVVHDQRGALTEGEADVDLLRRIREA